MSADEIALPTSPPPASAAPAASVATSTSSHQGTAFRSLFRKLEAALAQIERIDNVAEMLETILESLLQRFETDLGFVGGRIYERQGDEYVLVAGFGRSRTAPPSTRRAIFRRAQKWSSHSTVPSRQAMARLLY